MKRRWAPPDALKSVITKFTLLFLSGKSTSITKDELKPTQKAVEKVHMICVDKKVGSELTAEL